jgi:hypothetical protein
MFSVYAVSKKVVVLNFLLGNAISKNAMHMLTRRRQSAWHKSISHDASRETRVLTMRHLMNRVEQNSFTPSASVNLISISVTGPRMQTVFCLTCWLSPVRPGWRLANILD